jgi:hypothetical protein
MLRIRKFESKAELVSFCGAMVPPWYPRVFAAVERVALFSAAYNMHARVSQFP